MVVICFTRHSRHWGVDTAIALVSFVPFLKVHIDAYTKSKKNSEFFGIALTNA